MQIPADLDREEVEVYRKQVEDMLNFCTDAAQTWADEGGRYEGQIPVWKGTARNRPFAKISHSAALEADTAAHEMPVQLHQRAA